MDALGEWGDDVTRVERLTGGGVNEVWSVRVHGRLAVGRLSRRSEADLGWDTELLRHLDRAAGPRSRRAGSRSRSGQLS